MLNRARGFWLELSRSLVFLPGLIVAAFAVLGIVLVEVDAAIDLTGVEVVFKGDGSAARTVLSVIAGSLITVAGLTFSITMVVLQLASSQFSPRILRSFFGDRLTQLTIGIYVGTFVYSILVLRAVGSFGDTGFVPRLSVTLASLLGIAAVVLLIVFLHHVSRLVQVSHVTAGIAHDTLSRTDVLYPEAWAEPVEVERGDELLAAWREEPPSELVPARPGYVQRVGVDELARSVAGRLERVAILVAPGDFADGETPVVEAWPADAAEACRSDLLGAVTIASERDLDQDVGFGIRQLTDTALRALSPGINDPMTAVTCIGYLRSILSRLAARAEPATVRRFREHELTVILNRRGFEEQLEAFVEISRHVAGDAWVASELLDALRACALAARRSGATERLPVVRELAAAVAEQARSGFLTERDRHRIDAALAAVERASA